MVECLHWIYSLIGHIPVVFSVSSTGGHYHYPIVLPAPSSLQSIWLTNDVIPLLLLACPTSPPNSWSHLTTLNALFPCKLSPSPVPFLPSSSPPPPPYSTATVPSKDSDTGPTSRYCYRLMCGPGMERPRPDSEALCSLWSTPGVPWNRFAAPPMWSFVPPPAVIYWTHIASSRGAIVEPDSHTSHIWVKGWGVPPISGGFNPNAGS